MLSSGEQNFPGWLTVLVVVKTLLNVILSLRVIKEARFFFVLLFVFQLSLLLSVHFMSGVRPQWLGVQQLWSVLVARSNRQLMKTKKTSKEAWACEDHKTNSSGQDCPPPDFFYGKSLSRSWLRYYAFSLSDTAAVSKLFLSDDESAIPSFSGIDWAKQRVWEKLMYSDYKEPLTLGATIWVFCFFNISPPSFPSFFIYQSRSLSFFFLPWIYKQDFYHWLLL